MKECKPEGVTLGSANINYDTRYFNLDFCCQWLEWILIENYAWSKFSVIYFTFEHDRSGPSFDVELGLLGFHLRLCAYLPWETRESREIEEALEEFDMDPDSGLYMVPIRDLRAIRLGEKESWELEHAGDIYELRLKVVGAKQ